MQVNANSIRSSVVAGVTPEASKAAAKPSTKTDSFEASSSLDEALKNSPEVRREEVERATRLVETGNYPPPELIHRLSRLLADVVTRSDS